MSGKPVAKQWAYIMTFFTVNLILFHKPKKDQCDFCTKYKHLDDSDHASMNDKIEEHQQGKTLIRAVSYTHLTLPTILRV